MWPFSISMSVLKSATLLILLIWLLNWTSSWLLFLAGSTMFSMLFVDVKLLQIGGWWRRARWEERWRKRKEEKQTRINISIDFRIRLHSANNYLVLFDSGLSFNSVSVMIALLLLFCEPFWYVLVDWITDVWTGFAIDERVEQFYCVPERMNRMKKKNRIIKWSLFVFNRRLGWVPIDIDIRIGRANSLQNRIHSPFQQIADISAWITDFDSCPIDRDMNVLCGRWPVPFFRSSPISVFLEGREKSFVMEMANEKCYS